MGLLKANFQSSSTHRRRESSLQSSAPSETAAENKAYFLTAAHKEHVSAVTSAGAVVLNQVLTAERSDSQPNALLIEGQH